MPELLGFQDRSSARSGFRARDVSPDSFIFTPESRFSLFSSASAYRCSFASDAHDRDSLASDFSLHLAGHESSSGSDPSPNPDKATGNIGYRLHTHLSRKGEKDQVQNDDNEAETDEPLDSARSSFSIALKECQDQRSRSETSLKKPGWRRPASLDLNSVTASSPRLGSMKKSSLTPRKSSAFPSPETPNYRQASAGVQKGWSSERVPLHKNSIKKNVSAVAMLPYHNGRTLPSKWEDAERWILSPSGDGARPSVAQPQRQQKSKSGPLATPGIAYYSSYLPTVPMFDGMNMENFMAGSPFSTGVIAADRLPIRSGGCDGNFPGHADPCMARSVSVHGCSKMLSQPSSPNYLDREVKDAATDISPVVSRRDTATQMSPVSSTSSSPKGRLSFSASALSVLKMQNPSSNLEGRDVQVDERVTVTRWSNKHRARVPGKSAENANDWRKKTVSARDITETSKNISKITREESKITAWENMQKAKAEAAIRKLEMKLEKKRSSSMDKIMNKVKSAQKKAQKMRSSVTANQSHQVDRPSNKIVSFRRTPQMGSLTGCFTCHAF